MVLIAEAALLGGGLMESVQQVLNCFGELRGRHCWNVQRVYGSLMRLSFGVPYVCTLQMGRDPDVRARKMWVEGDWSLNVHALNFSLSSGRSLVAKSTSKKLIPRIANELNGRHLLGVSLLPRRGLSRFHFFDGYTLECSREHGGEDQWSLVKRKNWRLLFRGSDRWALIDEKVSEPKWQRLEATLKFEL